MNNMNPLLNIATKALRRAGSIALMGYERFAEVKSEKTSTGKNSSNIAQSISKTMAEIISKSYPNHNIVSSEDIGDFVPQGENPDEVTWILSPICGHKNFLKNQPLFALSIAINIKGTTSVAIIYDPLNNDIFSAIRGKGARLNDRRLRLNDPEIERSVIATVMPLMNKSNSAKLSAQHCTLLNSLLQKNVDIRISGVTELDLAYIAANRFDGFIAQGLAKSYPAGELILREAGGIICDFKAGTEYAQKGEMIASSKKIIRELLAILK